MLDRTRTPVLRWVSTVSRAWSTLQTKYSQDFSKPDVFRWGLAPCGGHQGQGGTVRPQYDFANALLKSDFVRFAVLRADLVQRSKKTD